MTINRLVIAGILAATILSGGCATGPEVTVEPSEPFPVGTTFSVDRISSVRLPNVDVNLDDIVVESLSERGWVQRVDAPSFIVRYSIEVDRSLDVRRAGGRRGVSVVTDVGAGADVALMVSVLSDNGSVVWASADNVKIEVGTPTEQAREEVLEAFRDILEIIPVAQE